MFLRAGGPPPVAGPCCVIDEVGPNRFGAIVDANPEVVRRNCEGATDAVSGLSAKLRIAAAPPPGLSACRPADCPSAADTTAIPSWAAILRRRASANDVDAGHPPFRAWWRGRRKKDGCLLRDGARSLMECRYLASAAGAREESPN